MSILLALTLDALFGEPPTRLHPVAWIGRYLQRAGRGLDTLPPRAAFVRGAISWLLGGAGVVALAWLAQWSIHRAPAWIALPATALLLKPLFSFRMLVGEVRAVEAALQDGLEHGRRRLAHIVSRDTSQLNAGEVRESALESLSENLSDSVVAPLFWFALLGLPGAALYRFANTADAMWGYRGRWEWAGKFAARADDVFNFAPSRLTALLFVIAGSGRVASRSLVREARKTPSPNSGWPMAAFALALGVRLGKPGVYTLHPSGRVPTGEDSARGARLAIVAGSLGAAVAAALAWALGRIVHG